MTLADSHVKALLKEGTARAGNAATGGEWRVAPEAVTAAKGKAEEYLRALGESAARAAGSAKRSTLKADDIDAQRTEPSNQGAPPAFS